MKICKVCKRNLELTYFYKHGVLVGDTGEYYKLCLDCRVKAREANNRRKEKKSIQAQKHYRENKEKINRRNKEYRNHNKEKLSLFEKSPKRKESRKQWIKEKRQQDPCRFLYYSAKKRSKNQGIKFEISKQDIINIYPKNNLCPMLNIEIYPNQDKMRDNSPSLDRIIPNVGYTKDNIIVISYKANRIKNDATLQELKCIVSYLEALGFK